MLFDRVKLLGGRISDESKNPGDFGSCVYAGVAEVSVYVSNQHKGQKIGTRLLETLISESEKEGFWTLQAGIFSENIASLKIHENLGFRKVGVREKIGKMNGIWRDTILLERRSKIVGTEYNN